MAEEAVSNNKKVFWGLDGWTALAGLFIVLSLLSGAFGSQVFGPVTYDEAGRVCSDVPVTTETGEVIYESICDDVIRTNEAFVDTSSSEASGLATIIAYIVGGDGEPSILDRIIMFLSNFTLFNHYPWLMIGLYFLSFIMIIIIMNLMARITRIMRVFENKLAQPTEEGVKKQVSETQQKMSFSRDQSKRWQEIVEIVEDNSESAWKMAVIEADILLGELLNELGYSGDIGTQLKQVNPNTFLMLNEAWEAHKVRNIIAHRGKDFVLDQHETRRVIRLYEKVFQEWDFI